MTNDEIEDVFIIPEESFTTVRFTKDGLPGHAAVNSALVDYERKELFGWHFSILVEAENIRDDGMPTAEEQQVLVNFEEKIEPIIKAKGNALVLASVTHNGNRELIYRVRDPGVFQGSCRVNRFHYAASETGNAGRSGFSMTAPIGSQFRVFPDHRSGRFAFAAA